MLRTKSKPALVLQTHNQPINLMESLSRKAYQTGYGDFCLGRLLDRVVIGHAASIFEEIVTEVRHLQDPSAKRRSGTFPFLRLPISIRRMIYKEIFSPLYLNDMQTLYFRILSNRPNPNLWEFRGTYGWYVTKQKYAQRPRLSYTQLAAGVPFPTQPINVMSEQAYKTEKRRLEEKNETHPGRASNYRLEVVPRAPSFTLVRDHHTDLHIEWIRQLSNVCTQVRKEMGDVLWVSTIISSPERNGMWHLHNMLQERPLIHRSIKSLDLKMELSERQPLSSNLAAFPGWCTYIAENLLALESLCFTLELAEKDLDASEITTDPTATFSALGACSEIGVAKEFEVHMEIKKWSSATLFLKANDVDIRRALRKRQFLPLFRELMMPKCLREVDGDTEMVDASSVMDVSKD